MSFRWTDEAGNTDLTLENYPNLVQQYASRQLTFQSDIVNAFSGVMEAIPGEFFWGLLHSNFGSQLTWELMSIFSERRRDSGLHMPSWS